MPYTIILYPIIFIFMSRLWSVSHRHGYVTPADFVQGRSGSRGLSLAVAVTGFLATMPYIALQLVGIQAVLEVVGVGGGGNWVAKDLPLFIAFLVLALYTYTSGLRAPALIAFVKDILIYIVIIVAIIYLPSKVGGWGHVFDAAEKKMTTTTNPATGKPRRLHPRRRGRTGPTRPSPSGRPWRCSCTRTRSRRRSRPRAATRSARTPRSCPAYSFLLGLLALLGWVAIAAGTKPVGLDGKVNGQLVIPQLFEDMFPSWFAGVAFAAIAIGALVPAAIMSIAAANTFTRNIYKAWIKPDATRAAGGQGQQDHLARRQGVRAGLRADARQEQRDQLPAPRRHLDPPDVPGAGVLPLHAVVPPLGPARRLGGRHGLRHGGGLQRDEHGDRRTLRAGPWPTCPWSASSATSR